MSEFTKIVNIMQYTEVVYYREPMTPEEISDWA